MQISVQKDDPEQNMREGGMEGRNMLCNYMLETVIGPKNELDKIQRKGLIIQPATIEYVNLSQR